MSPSHALLPGTCAPLGSWPLCSSHALISLAVKHPLSIRTAPSGSTHLGISLFQSINHPTLAIPLPHALTTILCGFTPVICRPFFRIISYLLSRYHTLHLSIYVPLVPDGFFISLPGCAGPVNSLFPMLTIPNLLKPVRVKYKTIYLSKPILRGLLVPVLLLQDEPQWAHSPRVSRFYHSLCSLPDPPAVPDRSSNSIGRLWLPLSFCSRRETNGSSPPPIRSLSSR